jgi:two-component system, sensor histidine kinase
MSPPFPTRKTAIVAADDVAAILHDLRAPLGGIDAMAELLSRTRLDPEQDRLVSALVAASQHLRSVADGVLGASIAPAPALTLSDQLRAIADAARGRAIVKGLNFTAEIAADLPNSIPMAATDLRRVLENLIDNAIKATASGGISLSVSSTQNRLALSIRDTGSGMNHAQQAQLTDAVAAGNGLGLSLVRMLVDAAAGEIHCQSDAAAGTAITIKLPHAQKHRLAGRKPVALIVDDHPVNRQILSVMVQQFGLEPHEAASGEETLKLLERISADVVLLDEILPGLSGFQTLQRLRQRPELSALPIFSVTGQISPDLQRAYTQAGVTGFIEKPLTADAVGKALNSIGLSLTKDQRAA